MGCPELLSNGDFLPRLVPSPSEGKLTDEMAPSPNLARRILFMNCGDEKSMRKQIGDYIRMTFLDFGLNLKLANNVITVLKTVDKSYHCSSYPRRRTGESSGCHPWRVVAESLHLGENLFQNDSRRLVYLESLMAALHDLGEDQMGGTFRIDDRLLQWNIGNNHFVIDLRSLGLSAQESEILQIMGEALTKPPKEPEVFDPEIRARQKAAKLFSSASRLMKEYGRYYYLLPIMVERGDIRDNLRTEFVFDPGQRRYRLPEDKVWLRGKLVEKLYPCQLIARALGEKTTASDQEIISSLLKGRSFETIFGGCFAGRKEGKLAFFDPFPFGESRFKFASQEVASSLSLAA